ncbi:DUF4394 domain-containing protein [Hymenobacter weizhouensis]|uniref:DUF4394 domain-containing protein n=1 Tax=Hymenobacter sp. YIM 151500-1 TaxID=2987689 RepID=UPI0022269FFD|nr:DUF4394 domain-containing protein [Hymenobacter sp. YIM 151500-1]UYZ63344.1 DUF4394 domain-containing protein [Hymenobacter sp. YIM 151500-1]
MLPFSTRCSVLRRAGLLLGAAAALTAAAPAAAQTVYGLTIPTGAAPVTSLVSFEATAPGTLTSTLPVTGVAAGQTLVGLDFRPNTGELYALGYNPTGTQAQLYTINLTTAAATAVGQALTLDLGTTTARIGFDFNPLVDRIRVTAGNRANIRLHPVTGALVATDTQLAYAATDANAAQTPGVGASAYTNSYIGATSTILYNLDEANSRLVTQIPPNNGTLNSVGGLGLDLSQAGQAADLDIYVNPTTRTEVAYLTVATPDPASTGSTSILYTLNLGTGATSAVGAIGTLGARVTDIAVRITRPATLPAVTGQLAYALAGSPSTNLLTFDTAQPGTIRTSVGITGVAAAQTLVGIDVRPLNNVLYGLGYDAATQTGQLYTLNPATGVATPTGNSLALALGSGSVAFDFNPAADRIRVEGVNRANFRLNPNDGTAAPAPDKELTYATGDVNASATPAIGSVAYTNSFPGPAGDATTPRSTELFGYDEALNVLVRQSPPNDGTLSTIGASGITVTPGANVDMDIFSSAAGTNTAYLVAATGGATTSSLYSLNLSTGAATSPALIGLGITVRDLAVAGPAGVATGIRRPEVAADFTLYPNPVADAAWVSFRLPRAGRATLTLTDALGRTLEEKSTETLAAGPHTLTWQPGTRRAGVYLLRLTVDGQTAGTQRILVQ